jgi:hypothetical protein
MKELMGLVVLSMPILAVLCIAGLAGFAGWTAVRRVGGARGRRIVSMTVGLAVILAFTGDEILGRFYFAYLCTTDAHVKVFERGYLPLEYWGSNRIPKANIVRNGSQFETQIGDRFYVRTETQKHYSELFSIDKDTLVMRDRASDALLSELVVFRYWGGWVARAVSLDQSASSCPATQEFDNFYRESFVKTPER